MGYVTKTHFLKQTHLGSLLEPADPSEADFTATKGTSAAWPVFSPSKVSCNSSSTPAQADINDVRDYICDPEDVFVISVVVDHGIWEFHLALSTVTSVYGMGIEPD